MSGLLLAGLTAFACAGQTTTIGNQPDKSYGVLLLGDGGDLNWKAAVEAVRKRFAAKGRPFEFAQGPADAKEIQRAVDRLQTRGVKKIVAVPLFLSSFAEVIDENRYLFGIREKPPGSYSDSLKRMGARAQARLKLKVPVVLARALDDSEALVAVLAARAKAQSREPAKEILVLVGEAPADPDELKDWTTTVDALAEKVRAKAGLRFAKAAALSEALNHKERDKSEAEVKKLVGALAAQGPVIVVPLELSQGVIHIRLPRVLDGSFARVDAKPLVADAGLADWVEQSAEAAAKLPDMRTFKDPASGVSAMQPASKLEFGSKPSTPGGHR